MENSKLSWAKTQPADLTAIAVTTFGFFGILTADVGTSGYLLFAAWMFGGFVIQLIAAILNVLRGDEPGSNLGLVFSCYLMLTGSMSFAIKYFSGVYHWPIDPAIEGYLWMPIWFALWLWTPAFWRVTPFSFNLVVLGLDVAIPLLSLSILGVWGGAGMVVVPWALLVTGLAATWTAAAILLSGAFQRLVLPVGNPLIKGMNSDKQQSVAS